MASSLDDLLARRSTRPGPVPVNAGDVMRWSEAHRVQDRRHWPGSVDRWVAPPAMVTTFARLLEWHPDQVGASGERGPTLHDEVKAACGLPSGIASGYELELHALLVEGDRLEVTERLASLGEPETTRVGPGRRWVIENEIRRAGAGDLVAVERFLMLGYDPAGATAARSTTAPPAPSAPAASPGSEATAGGLPRTSRVEELDVTGVAIVMGATANRVWTPAHLDRDAAQAAGIDDIFLDTSTQVGLLSVVGGRAADPAARPGRLSLRMRRPVLAGEHLVLEAVAGRPETDAAGVAWVTVEVRASVGDELRSTLSGRYAVPGPSGVDPWELGPDRWRP